MVKNVRAVARPVLSEPFWNEGVAMSEALMKTYQMTELPMDTVLKSDRQKLDKMKQPEILDKQLKVESASEVIDCNNVFVPGVEGVP